MPSLIERTGVFLLVCCAAACLNHAAAATELNYLPAPSPLPTSRVGPGFISRTNRLRLPAPRLGVRWTPLQGLCFAQFGHGSGQRKLRLQFPIGEFRIRPGGLSRRGQFRRQVHQPLPSRDGAWTPNMNWLGTVTGRVGYSFGQWLPYVKGGFAAADVGSPLQGAPTGGFSQGTEVGGWTGGVGLEYQISPKLVAWARVPLYRSQRRDWRRARRRAAYRLAGSVLNGLKIPEPAGAAQLQSGLVAKLKPSCSYCADPADCRALSQFSTNLTIWCTRSPSSSGACP